MDAQDTNDLKKTVTHSILLSWGGGGEGGGAR